MPKTTFVMDFGSSYTDRAEVTVTGLATITTGAASAVEAWMRAEVSTDHSEDEHIMLKNTVEFEVPMSSIVASSSCKVVATCYDPPGMYGKLNGNLAYDP